MKLKEKELAIVTSVILEEMFPDGTFYIESFGCQGTNEIPEHFL